MNFIKKIIQSLSGPATGKAEQIAKQHLVHAQCAALEAEAHAEYYTQMAAMYRGRIARLTAKDRFQEAVIGQMRSAGTYEELTDAFKDTAYQPIRATAFPEIVKTEGGL